MVHSVAGQTFRSKRDLSIVKLEFSLENALQHEGNERSAVQQEVCHAAPTPRPLGRGMVPPAARQ
eukprot:643308-Prymnesium_polylepis.1